MPKIAIIMTGHKRMVPYGYWVLEKTLKGIPAEYDIFSYTWDDDSDVRPVQNHKNLDTTNLILKSLDRRNKSVVQGPILNNIYNQWVQEGVIPNTVGLNKFSQFLGQIMGFLLALDNWEKELLEYDYIIRARWDILIDRLSVDTMLLNGPESNVFLTKGIYVHYGQLQLSGDTIYGSRKYWLNNFLPIATTLNKISKKTKSVNNYASSVISTNEESNFRDHFFNCKWWSSHAIWAMLLCDTEVSVFPSGEAFPLGEKLLTIPPDEITVGHIVAMGAKDI